MSPLLWLPMFALRAGVAALALLLAPTIYAGEARVSWTAPTERVDGTALTYSSRRI